MARRQKLIEIFKKSHQDQLILLPPSLDELISSDHPVRVVSSVLDKVDISQLLACYKGGGKTSYHPRTLLKILVYGYINNIYSSRKLEESVNSNIYFMWLAGISNPDHNTINRFQGESL